MFFSRKEKPKKDYSKLTILGVLVLLLNLIGGIFYFLQPKKIKRFVKGEKKEIEELSRGKESWSKFSQDSSALLKDLFIPHDGNGHKPKVLRPKSLVTYVALALIIKLSVTGFLFFTYPSPAELAAIVSERMVRLVNESRVEAGVEPLNINEILIDSASAKGQDMMDREYFAHDTPEGKRPWQWIDRNQYDYVYAGENLAIDFKSAEAVHDALMKSPTHRKNILNPHYNEIGMAVLEGQFEDRETILLVQFFGTQRKDFSTLAANQPAINQPADQPASEPSPTVELAATVAGQETVQLPVSLPLEAGVANEGVIVIASEHQSSKSLVDFVIEYSNIFFIAFLIFILVSLVLNIFVHIRVQHSSVIVQTIVVAALVAAMVLVKFHFAEQISSHILIL